MDVFLLGAGFSKALHQAMPLMSELGATVCRNLQLPDETLEPFGGDFEAWFSYLAEPQPWFSNAEAHDNAAMFERASQQVYSIILKAHPERDFENKTLEQLAQYWVDHNSHIITFNYDLIVEQALNQTIRGSAIDSFYEIPLTSRRKPGGLVIGPKQLGQRRPHLYKLHGSLNWLWGGEGDQKTPASINDSGSDGTLYSDLKPMVIPPTSSKSMFYDHRGLRAQWRSAYRQLRSASRLIVIGYSMPLSDLQVRAMLASGLRKDTELVVADYNSEVAESIAARLHNLRKGTVFSGDLSVEKLAASL